MKNVYHIVVLTSVQIVELITEILIKSQQNAFLIVQMVTHKIHKVEIIVYNLDFVMLHVKIVDPIKTMQLNVQVALQL